MIFGSIVQTLLIQVKANAMQLHVHIYIKDLLPDSVVLHCLDIIQSLSIPVNFQQQQQQGVFKNHSVLF